MPPATRWLFTPTPTARAAAIGWPPKAAAAGFKIEIVGAGGADATNKLIAEKNNPVADVAFGLNNMYFSQVKTEGALEAVPTPHGPETWTRALATSPPRPTGRW